MPTSCRKGILDLPGPAPLDESRSGNFSCSSTDILLGLLLSFEKYTKLDSPVGYFKPCQYNITKNGKPVVEDPDDKTPPHFEAKIASNLSFFVNPNGTTFSVMVDHHVLRGETSQPVPWAPRGKGPESWLEYLPLPFHWFVYSLRSTVQFYEYINMNTGQVISGKSSKESPVVAHMEKNWGKSFPKAWVWSQGVNPESGVAFVFSAGLVTELNIDIKAQLSGYRNPVKRIECNFSPSNSFHSLHSAGCAGTVTLKVSGAVCSVIFQVVAPVKSFSFCLPAPMADGFRKGCTESYVAVANITVYQRHGLHMVVADTQTVHFSALEFGGAYMCDGQCPVE